MGTQLTMLAGVGIDLERKRVPAKAARLFLTESEREWIQKITEQQDLHLQRLWTIKEALFKANPKNRSTVLADYSLANPEAWKGRASWNGGEIEFYYECAPVFEGVIALALAFPGGSHE